jgi:hypothetical protein
VTEEQKTLLEMAAIILEERERGEAAPSLAEYQRRMAGADWAFGAMMRYARIHRLDGGGG